MRLFYIIEVDQLYHVLWWSTPFPNLASARQARRHFKPTRSTSKYEVVGVMR